MMIEAMSTSEHQEAWLGHGDELQREDGPSSFRRILYHHRTQGQGVEGVHIRGLAGGLSHCGVEVDVLGPPGCGAIESAEPSAARDGRSQRGVVQSVLRWFAGRMPEIVFELAEIFYNAYSLVRLLWATRRGRYDAIYERYAMFHVAGVLAARLRGMPIAMEVNDSAVIERSRPLVLRRLAGVLEGWALRRSSVVVTVSKDFRQRLAKYGLEGWRTIVTPNAVDPAQWAQSPADARSGDSVVVGCVAAFVAWHRPDFLVDCVAEVMARHDVRLVLIGDGPARAAAEELAGRLGCGDKVEFTGTLPHEQVRRRLAEFDIAVMPHSNAHGSPMKILEYMAAGKAIVAPATGPICELITDGVTGLLFEPLSRSELVEKLAMLAADGELRRRLGVNARFHVMRCHTWEINARRVLGVLELEGAAKPR